MWTGAVYLEGVATTGMPSPTPASLLMCVTLDIISVTSVTCHQAECWVMTLCPMLLRLFSLRDWPVVPAVAGDWALVAGPGALSSLSLSLSLAPGTRHTSPTPGTGPASRHRSGRSLVRTSDPCYIVRHTSRHKKFASFIQYFVFRLSVFPNIWPLLSSGLCLCLECLQPRACGRGLGE